MHSGDWERRSSEGSIVDARLVGGLEVKSKGKDGHMLYILPSFDLFRSNIILVIR